jgi:hypothetical protein
MIRPRSITALLQAVRIAKANPYARFEVPGNFSMDSQDVLRMWSDGLMAKCNRGLPQLTPTQRRRYLDTRLDARVINDYARGIRSSGSRGMLRTARMQRLYPHINNQPREY